jgi:hypothetical protein
LILFGVVSLVFVFIYTTTLEIADIVSAWLPSSFASYVGTRKPRFNTCSPREYAQGRWVEQPYYTRPGPLSRSRSLHTTAGSPDAGSGVLEHGGSEKTHIRNLTRKEDIFNLTRFEGCASVQDYWWHFAVDQEVGWDRFPRALNWEWIPGGRCHDNLENGGGLREWDSVQVLQYLLDEGSWLMLGGTWSLNYMSSSMMLIQILDRLYNGEPLLLSIVPPLPPRYRHTSPRRAL